MNADGSKTPRSRKLRQLRWWVDGAEVTETLPKDTTAAGAKKLRARKEADLNAGRIPLKPSPKMTFADLVAHDRACIVDLQPNTRQIHKDAVRRAMSTITGDKIVSSIMQPDVAALKAGMKATGDSPSTINQTIRVMSAMWNRGMQGPQERWLVRFNPWLKSQVDSEPRPARRFTADEKAAIFEAADVWWTLYLVLGLSLGLRKNELAHLRWEDVDFEAEKDDEPCPVVMIRSHKAGVADGCPLLAWSVKAKASRREIEIDDYVVDMLKRRHLKSDSPYVFVSAARLHHVQAKLDAGEWGVDDYELLNNTLRDFKVLQGKARNLLAERRGLVVHEVPWKLGCLHDLRKSFVNASARRLKPDALLAVAGHSDPRTTLGYMTRTEEDSAQVRAAGKLSRTA